MNPIVHGVLLGFVGGKTWLDTRVQMENGPDQPGRVTFEFLGAGEGYAEAERGIRNLRIGIADSPAYQRYSIDSPEGDVFIRLLIEEPNPDGADAETAAKLRRVTYTIGVGRRAESPT